MEIRNVFTRQPITSPNQTLMVQKGETYDAVIKESRDGEAVVVIKGTDVRVRTEGEWPKEGRATIKIVGEQDGLPVARFVSRPQEAEVADRATRPVVSRLLSAEWKQVESWLHKQGQSLTKEAASTLQTFFAEGPGTVEQKLDTVHAVINKKLELTSTHLLAVHEALHGQPFGERLVEIVKKLDPAFALGKQEAQGMENETAPNHSLDMADDSERMRMPVADTFTRESSQGKRTADGINEMAVKADRQFTEISASLKEVIHSSDEGQKAKEFLQKGITWHNSAQTVQTEKPSASATAARIHQVSEQVAREPNLSKAVDYVCQHVVEAADVDRNVAERLDRVLREVVQLQRQGLKIEARVRLNQALIQMEQEVRASEAGHQLERRISYDSGVLAKRIRDIRTEAERTLDLSQVLPRVRDQLAENSQLPAAVRQKVETLLKETAWLQQIGQHGLAKTHLVRQLAQLEQAAAVDRAMHPAAPVSARQAANVQETVDSAAGKQTAQTPAASPLEQIDSAIEHRLQRHASPINVQSETADLEQWTEQMKEAIRRVIKLFQHEPILEKALDAVQGKMREALHSQPHWRQSWDDALAKAMELKEKGRELAARQTVLKTLNEIDASLSSLSNDRISHIDALFDGSWQAGLPLQTKDFLVQTVTKKMAQAARDFQMAKRDIMRHLEAALQWAEQGGQSTRLQVKQLLETAMKQLDNAILKSDILLFTDMTTEKQLMKASSQLAEAKKRLHQGDERGARKIVNEVKNVLANMVLKPSETKVKHFVAGLGEPQADLSKAFLQQMNEAVQPFVDGPSARQLFEALRRFGFMHDYEAAESLVQKGADGEGTPQNMKATLLQLAQSGNEPIARQAEQALTNLTGQQLLNRWDAGAGMQSLFFSLPLLWRNEVRNVNVYVNARQDGERIDWENCRLYFLLETKKLGDLGILLQANERSLSITLRNDRDDFAEKAAPFIDMAKERLEEIGYRVTSVNVTKLTNETKRQEEEKRAPSARSSAAFTERGYDFTI
ncbi:hypothetical protein JCM12214_26800 [Geobacillus vulcani]